MLLLEIFKMAPSILSNSSILLADAFVKEKDKTTEFAKHLPKKPQKVNSKKCSIHSSITTALLCNNSFKISL